MISYLSKKIISILLTFFLLVSASFFMLHSLPGNPFEEGKRLSPAIILKLEKKYGLDKPLFQQYCSYITNLLLKADLGPSLKYPDRDVGDILADALPVSLLLGFFAFIIAVIFGLSLGTVAALAPNSWSGRLASAFSSLGMSMPSFVFAGILIYIFALSLGWLPVALLEGPEYFILPAFTLAVAPSAYIARITRSSMIETLAKQHIKTALAKGLSYWNVVIKHGLRNSLVPIVTVLGPIAAILITGSFVVEYIFALPGMGKYFVTAFTNRDYFLVSGVIVVFSIVLLVINTIVDLLIRYLNPKAV
ncbi:MAG: ABC transporter permease [Cyanobacteria bacterium]|nr:ABC transporter permease [Cyanobacteriota bacterium]MDA1021001.1 ABC transporter permease [Cyanobacteriota bacterium]